MELADRIALGRARGAIVLAIVFIASQGGSFREDPASASGMLHFSAWIVWALALLVFLVFGGGILRGREVRGLVNDETTREHRRDAMVLGFWGAIGGALVIYLLSFFEPISSREAVRMVMTAAIALALLRFGTLEKAALKDG